MLRHISLLTTEGRVIESAQPLPTSVDGLFTSAPVDADYSQHVIDAADRQSFHESLGKARADGTPVVLTVRHVTGPTIELTVRWLEVIGCFLTTASTKGGERVLTERQTHVLRLLCQDKTLGEIANALDIKVTTVQTYASRLRDRAKVATNHGLAIWAIKNGKI